MVKTTPPASDSPAEPIVWTMLFSRIVDPPSFLRTEIARTAIGIDALTVKPARRPRYTVDAPKSSPKSAPRMMALIVNSAGDWEAGTYGRNAPLSGGVCVTCAMARDGSIEPCESVEQAETGARSGLGADHQSPVRVPPLPQRARCRRRADDFVAGARGAVPPERRADSQRPGVLW